jgi:hypothetical protein
MKPDEKSKLQGLIGDVNGLKSRDPEEKKFKEWKEKVEKQLEETFGKNSEPVIRFRRIRFFDFARRGRSAEGPLKDAERREYNQRLDEAKRALRKLLY